MEHVSLEGDLRIRSADGRYDLVARMPGSLFHALEQDGHLGAEGLFYGENNRRCLKIADRDFTFGRRVVAPPSFVGPGGGNDRRVFLEADAVARMDWES